MKESIVIIDLGIGNLTNVEKALDAEVSDDISDIERADKIVLPGVGNFGGVMEKLEPLKGALIDFIKKGKPFLGICLGMQLLYEKSEECEGTGLGVFKGEVVGFRDVPPPHIGWNQVYRNKECRLLRDIEDGEFFYFVHSYFVNPVDSTTISASTGYQGNGDEIEFPAIVSKENVYGVQFHPEKSSRAGLRIMKNFKEMV